MVTYNEKSKNNTKKKKYIAPEITVIKFETKDIITTSGAIVGSGDNKAEAPSKWWD